MVSASHRLTDREFALVQAYTSHIVDAIVSLGLSPEIEHNFDEFCRVRGKVEDGFVNPTYNPAVSDLSERALWVRAVDIHGDTVATSAARVFHTNDFYDLMRDGTLWYRQPTEHLDHVVLDTTIGPLSGIVGHAGGTWVREDWRGRQLSSLLPKFARALMLRNHDIDHETGFVFGPQAMSTLPTRLYGYVRIAKVLEGYFPPGGPGGRQKLLYICHLTRAEALAEMTETLNAERQTLLAS